MEKDKIIDCYSNVFLNIDQKNWAKCKESFVDVPEIDASLSGSSEPKVKSGDLMTIWNGFLGKYTTIMHFVDNHNVTIAKDAASATCYAHILHVIPGAPGGDSYEIFGIFSIKLVKQPNGWKINYLKFDLKHQAGNKDLPMIAAKQ